jgi:hypothetical protein
MVPVGQQEFVCLRTVHVLAVSYLLCGALIKAAKELHTGVDTAYNRSSYERKLHISL